MDAIKNLPGNMWFPEGGRLLVEATVIEKATGAKEKSMNNSAVFTSTPYIIKYEKTAEYFKPGLPFVASVSSSFSLLSNTSAVVNFAATVNIKLVQSHALILLVEISCIRTQRGGSDGSIKYW